MMGKIPPRASTTSTIRPTSLPLLRLLQPILMRKIKNYGNVHMKQIVILSPLTLFPASEWWFLFGLPQSSVAFLISSQMIRLTVCHEKSLWGPDMVTVATCHTVARWPYSYLYWCSQMCSNLTCQMFTCHGHLTPYFAFRWRLCVWVSKLWPPASQTARAARLCERARLNYRFLFCFLFFKRIHRMF